MDFPNSVVFPEVVLPERFHCTISVGWISALLSALGHLKISYRLELMKDAFWDSVLALLASKSIPKPCGVGALVLENTIRCFLLFTSLVHSSACCVPRLTCRTWRPRKAVRRSWRTNGSNLTRVTRNVVCFRNSGLLHRHYVMVSQTRLYPRLYPATGPVNLGSTSPPRKSTCSRPMGDCLSLLPDSLRWNLRNVQM